MRGKPLIRQALQALLLAMVCTGGAQAVWCNVNGGAVAFGLYDPTSAANLDTTGSLALQCNSKFSVVLSLSVGNGAGASYSSGRKMTRAGGGTLRYNLYANAARTQVLGDGTNTSVTLAINDRNSFTQAIWGRIPGNQNTVRAGSYNDTIIATISY